MYVVLARDFRPIYTVGAVYRLLKKKKKYIKKNVGVSTLVNRRAQKNYRYPPRRHGKHCDC